MIVWMEIMIYYLGVENKMEKVNVLREVTDWEYPNHTYVTIRRNQRCIGYYRNNVDYVEFVKPLPFYTTRRKFEADRAKEKVWNADSE